MIFNSYQNNLINIKRRNSQKTIKIINDYPYKLSKSLLKKKQSNQSLSSFSFKAYKPNQNNYINYTVLENKQKENYCLVYIIALKNNLIYYLFRYLFLFMF